MLEHYPELLACLAQMPHGIVAIDGGCASGKTTLALELAGWWDATLLHMDDFFLQPHQQTPDRLAEVGGNADRERFLQEVLQRVQGADALTFQPYNCAVQVLGEPITVPVKPRVIVEGVYCMHPDLMPFYNVTVFLHATPQVQRERLLKRNGPALLKRFEAEWIPKEEAYFAHFQIAASCDFVYMDDG